MTEPGLYVHSKRNLYIVLGTVTNSTNDAAVPQEVMVLYYLLETGNTSLRVRRETEFHEEGSVGETKTPRFKKVVFPP